MGTREDFIDSRMDGKKKYKKKKYTGRLIKKANRKLTQQEKNWIGHSKLLNRIWIEYEKVNIKKTRLKRFLFCGFMVKITERKIKMTEIENSKQ